MPSSTHQDLDAELDLHNTLKESRSCPTVVVVPVQAKWRLWRSIARFSTFDRPSKRWLVAS